jgi:hypothetical protein
MGAGQEAYKCVVSKVNELAGLGPLNIQTAKSDAWAAAARTVSDAAGLPTWSTLDFIIDALVVGGLEAGKAEVLKRHGSSYPDAAEKIGALIEKVGCGAISASASTPVSTAGRVVAPEASTVSLSKQLVDSLRYSSIAEKDIERMSPSWKLALPAGSLVGGQFYIAPGSDALPGEVPGSPAAVPGSSNKNTALILGAAALAALLFLR